MPSTKRVEPLDGFERDVPITSLDSEAQWRIRARRTISTPDYLAWCRWLTRDSVAAARDRHTRVFELHTTGDAAPTMNSTMIPSTLPGSDLVSAGIDDLRRGVESIEALLVSIGAPRLRRAGIDVPDETFPDAERRLYDLLARESGDNAHSRYNGLIRRLISFEQAARCCTDTVPS